ncbi:MAG TPA: hypothetical protein ENK49_09960 [Gammaproteobacteria bacterium]|nr:hypothetical protein [Gammaproteobacteria bacterium]
MSPAWYSGLCRSARCCPVSGELVVWSQGRRVGEIGLQQGRWQFAYDAEWIGWVDAFPLSPHFPFMEAPFVDSADDRRVEWFFENLLPEGGLRESLARYAGVSSQDTPALLRRYGEESAGALTILPAGMACPTDYHYVHLAVDELRKRLNWICRYQTSVCVIYLKRSTWSGVSIVLSVGRRYSASIRSIFASYSTNGSIINTKAMVA